MPIKVGLLGCGAIGTYLANQIDRDGDFSLLCIYDLDRKRCTALRRKLKGREKPRTVSEVSEMAECDLIIEAASQDAVREHALDILEHSDLMVMSVGAFTDSKLFSEVVRKARARNRRVYIPSGAVPGLDALKAASLGKLEKVTLTSRKPPSGLEGAPWVVERGISLKAARKPTVIFEGPASEAVRWFPKNVNVSAALSLAGIGPDKTMVKVVVDPFSDRNVHVIEAEGSFGSMSLRTENLPSPSNKKTSYLAALSAAAMLQRIKGNVIVGT